MRTETSEPMEHGDARAGFGTNHLDRDIRSAILRDEFLLHYQPIVEFRSGQTVGVEALVRWDHPRFGLLSPETFIPMAERTGDVVPLGRWVLDEACGALSRWDRDYPELPLTMNVNVSVQQLLSCDFMADAANLLWRRGIEPDRIVFEITESQTACTRRARQQIEGLKHLGFRLAMDDFGTGYSSLSSLRACPFDVLKIDQSFVVDVARNARDRQLVHLVIELGHMYGMEVNAEGIEEREQCMVLGALGCDVAQGFYFGKPLDGSAFEAYMHSRLGAIRRSADQPSDQLALAPGAVTFPFWKRDADGAHAGAHNGSVEERSS